MVPEGYKTKDIKPWRFRRMLSLLMQPLLPVDPKSFLIAPAFLHESCKYMINGYYNCVFSKEQCRSQLMKKWFDIIIGQRGTDFAKNVAERFFQFGWNVKYEIHVREILKRRSDPKYGNINVFGDVDVLAWNNTSKRILIIECKHLQSRRIQGEIAEQLSDYRGQKKQNGKSDDLLKHLNRLDILEKNRGDLCEYLNMPRNSSIEGWIIFNHKVPMLYMWKNVKSKMKIAAFDEIHQDF